MILNTFACYYSCKKELDKMEKRRKIFFNSIPGVGLKGISYTDFIESTNSKSKLSDISDALNDWDKHSFQFKRYCESVISMCEGWLDQMDEPTRLLFKLRYIDGKTLYEVSEAVGYDFSWIAKKIRKESEKIKIG